MGAFWSATNILLLGLGSGYLGDIVECIHFVHCSSICTFMMHALFCMCVTLQ